MRVLLYDQNTKGHNPSWLYVMASACLESGCDVFVAARDSPEVNEWLDKLDGDKYHRVYIGDLRKGYNYAKDAARLTREHQCEMLLFPFFDYMLMEMKLILDGLLNDSIDIGGIIFRPPLKPAGIIDYFKFKLLMLVRTAPAKKKRTRLRNLLRMRRGVKCLHDYVAQGNEARVMSLNNDKHFERIKELMPYAHVGRLNSDPSLSHSKLTKEEARKKNGLPLGKYIFLHCGLAGEEKGLSDTYYAWCQIPDHCKANAILVRAGKVECEEQAELIRSIGILLDYYIPQQQLDDLYAACDCVIIPYRNHTGTSGVLINAAAAGKPVIAPDFSVIGKMVKEHELGCLFEHMDVNSLSSVMEQVMSEKYIQSAAAKRFVDSNSVSEFKNELKRFFLERKE